MLEYNKGVDILCEIGGVKSAEEVEKTFRSVMDDESLGKIRKIRNADARLKIANAIAMGKPDRVFVNAGTPEDHRKLVEMALANREEDRLALKDHYIHFDLPEEQGRIVDRTLYVVNEGESVSSLARKILRADAHKYVRDVMVGMMKGMTMIVGFYSRGPIGAYASIPAIEATTSAYVCHSGELLYRNCFEQFDAEIDRVGHFFTNVHCQGLNRPEDLPNARVLMDRSWLTTFATYCTYAGNTLLLKKGNHRFAVDRATYFRVGQEISEHMFITGIEGPGGRTTFFAGAAPSGCGKTTTAMVGREFISDDLAQIWIADDGSIRSINPENGIFGIIEDVNWTDDPLMLKILRNEVTEIIFSNVLIDGNKKPHWVGSGEETPDKGFNFQGEWFDGKTDAKGKKVPLSHPNARFTLKADALDNYSKRMDDPAGVITRVFTYNGRDSDTMPPVWVAKSPDHGVVIGASIVSAATATEVGSSGVKREPWANQPFTPGALGDYMKAQFEFFNSPKVKPEYRPILAGINYFLTEGARGGEGKKLLGEKKDVHVWMGWLERVLYKEVTPIETPIGLIPKYEDLKSLFKTLVGKEYGRDLYDRQFSLYVDNIVARIDMQHAAFKKDERIPDRMFEIYDEQKTDLLALKAKFGSVVKPEQLAK